MKTFWLFLTTTTLATTSSASDLTLWYDKPATQWEQQALPIGNGRLAAMCFGGVEEERIQFNEESLWTGDESDTGFYQAFGEVRVVFSGPYCGNYTRCASGQQSSESESVAHSIDGSFTTKWCVEHHHRPVVWLTNAGAKTTISSYAMTSANDMPDRDPKSWTLEGSTNNKSWTLLDKRTNQPPFLKRQQQRTYNFANNKPFQYYRFTFSDFGSPTHFQVAEIELGNIDLQRELSNMKYHRDLDLGRAVHSVTFCSGGVQYRREYFASHPAGVIVLRFSADKPGVYTGTVALTDAHDGKINVENSTLSASGSLKGYRYDKNYPVYKIGLQYESRAVVVNQGGTLHEEDGTITFKNADSLTIYLDAGTNFVQERSKNWQGKHPRESIVARLEAAHKTSYDRLLAEHEKDYKALFDRVALRLDPTDKAAAKSPTDKRVNGYLKNGRKDMGLEVLVFQFGRYLMISSSRPGGLPANLQGKWNISNNPPWRSDYHADVNVQMNYWVADSANLSECFGPLAAWLNSIREVRKEETKKTFNTRGWTMHGENGIFGGSTWEWIASSSAWCMQNVWDHYAFTGDKEYLRVQAYPMMKEVCEFWIDRLKCLPDGTLVAPNGYSPEHGPREDGVSHDQQLIWDVFNNTIEAADTLNIDREFRDVLTAKRDKLLTPKIGRWGQLQEWMVDRDDPNDTHRHLSHLVAVHPGRQISMLKTPELAKAAIVSLNARGDVSTGWSTAWKINLWARLHDGDHAYKLIGNLFRPVLSNAFNMNDGGGLYHNLLDAHPPFQIDGNFGYTSGVCEMLLQSHTGEIELLPALPKAWANGSVRGLRARGGIEVDITWQNGLATAAALRPSRDCMLRIRPPAGQTIAQISVADRPLELTIDPHGAVTTHAKAGEPCQITFRSIRPSIP